MRILFTILLGTLFTLAYSQDHVCGTSVHDQLMLEAKARIAGPSKYEKAGRLDKIYIPVKIHIVTQGNGEGGVKHSSILNQFCKLNADYAKWEMVFYPKDGVDYSYIANGNAYNDPRTHENFLANRKDDSALNVFVTGTIGASMAGPGTVLGYYSPSNDLVVCQLAEFAGSSNTLSHEAGHFFTLRHTFFGWEGDPYVPANHGNQVNFLNAPGTQIPVEIVERSNCEVAADLLCDTPPDYNFGITSTGAGGVSNGCGLSAVVKDRNGESVIPMANNQMSYFDACPSYEFTEDQYNQMLDNYNSALRDFLRSTYVPNENEVLGSLMLTAPGNGETIENYNFVDFAWEGVTGADYYLLEVENSAEYYFYFSEEPNITVFDLNPDENYFVKAFAFNDANMCADPSNRILFKTGSGVSGTLDQSLFEDVVIAPNPATDKIFVSVTTDKTQDVIISVYDLTGKLILNDSFQLNSGKNNKTIDITDFNSGIHIVQIETPNGKVAQKLSVIK